MSRPESDHEEKRSRRRQTPACVHRLKSLALPSATPPETYVSFFPGQKKFLVASLLRRLAPLVQPEWPRRGYRG
jgi:hypothetical protein